MTQISTEQLITEWQALLDNTPNSVCTSTQQLSEQHAPELAQSFYKTMLPSIRPKAQGATKLLLPIEISSALNK